MPCEMPLPVPVSLTACQPVQSCISFETFALAGTESTGDGTTVMATSVTHGAPRTPQDFTCTMCAPVPAPTSVLTAVPGTIVVLELSSME